MDDSVYVGNAGRDGAGNGGWLLGHFMADGDVRHSTDVEVKWGVHAAGERRERWATGERRTALLVLVSGAFRVELPDRTVRLGMSGDYLLWGRGVDHSWYAERDSVLVTVRWPSVPGYRVGPPVRP
ncbi:signal peptidase I [Micromonospora cathayae]|uniref:Signal peptidase I n=1 Tax=Micromonospora cathayae TaxID=3028804 RepID=A0ABY7ZI35_9ACTN|nr:signal peptidase I [Micromonospora sp. HUAS 3]WDZ82545.1 signal peptidase I [Micromonospora sp. HUAS 3]